MRHLALTAALACALALPAGAHAVMSGGGAEPADAGLRLVSCRTGLEVTGPSLTVDSTMRSLRAGDRMAMRFELWQRPRGALRFRRLAGPGLNTWNTATPGVQRFRFRKPIQNLPAPALYLVRARYRWTGADGALLGRAVRTTRTCRQPDVRADLRIVSVGQPERRLGGRYAYPTIVHNAGRAASRDFDAVLMVGDAAQPPRSIASLAPGERRQVELLGPGCGPGTVASVQLDPDGRVDESDERNNVHSLACA